MAGKKHAVINPRASPSAHSNGSATASNSKRLPKVPSASPSGAPKPRKSPKPAPATTKGKRRKTDPQVGDKRKKPQASGQAATPTKKAKRVRDDPGPKPQKHKVAKREKKEASGGAEKPAPPVSTPSKKQAASGGSEKPAATPTKKHQASGGAGKTTPGKRKRGGAETQKEAKSASRASGQAAKRKDKAVAGAGQGSCSFPMRRVQLLMRAEDAGIRPSSEAVFLINKASELFLEIFAEDAYHNTLKEHKKSIIYENLSTAVCNQKKYKFLSDFVPQKVAAGDALKASLKES